MAGHGKLCYSQGGAVIKLCELCRLEVGEDDYHPHAKVYHLQCMMDKYREIRDVVKRVVDWDNANLERFH